MRALAALALSLAVLGVASPGTPADAAARASRTRVVVPSSTPLGSDHSSEIRRLPNGDRVWVTHRDGGRVTVAPMPSRTGRIHPMRVLSVAGHVYAVPLAAATQLGRRYELSAFDVSPPGSREDAPPPQARRSYPMHTLTIRGINAQGLRAVPWRDAFWGSVVNMDDAARFSAPVVPVNAHGTARVSVPAGHYALDFSMINPERPGETRDVMRNITVDRDRRVVLDARRATVSLTAHGERPSRSSMLLIGAARIDRTGQGGSLSLTIGDDTFPPLITPMGRVRYGRAVFGFNATLLPLDSADTSYSYHLSRISLGHLVDQPIALAGNSSTTATLIEDLYSPVPGPAVLDHSLGSYATILSSGPLLVSAGSTHTSYVTAAPDVAVTEGYVTTPGPGGGALTPQYYSSPRTYAPGETRRISWGRAPLHLSMPETPVGPFTICAACLTASSTITLALYPFGDAEADHVGWENPSAGGVQSGNWQLSTDGFPLLGGPGAPGTWATLAPWTGEFRLEATERGAGSGSATPSTVHAVWTVPEPLVGTRPAPADWWCWPYPHGEGQGGCRLIPLLRSEVELPVALDNTVAAGTVSGRIRIRVLGEAAPVRLASASVEVSYDDGTTWQPAATTVTGDLVELSFDTPPAPATPYDVALRLTVTDTAGRGLEETTTAAFAVR